MNTKAILCPCGSNKIYSECCGHYLDGGEIASSAETLMRSRYTAYMLHREAYLLDTWHPSSRPAALGLANDVATKWLGLEVKRHELQKPDHALVEFVARYKVNGRAHRLHEVSRFVRENERWFYVDGDIG
jgi:SEC-C motif-containing protein